MRWVVAAHLLSPSTQEAEAGGLYEIQDSLVYRMSSRTARATQRNLVLKNKSKQKMVMHIFSM